MMLSFRSSLPVRVARIVRAPLITFALSLASVGQVFPGAYHLLQAQSSRDTPPNAALAATPGTFVAAIPLPFGVTPSDPLSVEIQREAEAATGRRLVVSITQRIVWLMNDAQVVHAARAGVGKSVILEYEDQRWDFRTPRGRRVIIGKERDPVWTPPEWHYVEMAALHRLQMQHLWRGRPVSLKDGSSLVIRGSQVGRVDPQGRFHPVPVGDEIVFDGTIFVPPFDTVNRRIPGELGRFKLDFGDNYYFHGTPYESSIGRATTHGCIRLLDDDLEFLYRHVPVGTPVYIY
jgi:hypothetical protein